MSKSSVKATVFICNIVITVLCAIAIASYFFLPFWKVDLTLHINAETFQKVMDEQGMENTTPDGETTDFSDIDFSEVLGEEGLHIELSIVLQTKQVLSALSGDATKTVQAIIDENVNKMVDQLNEPLQKLAHVVMETAAKVTLKDMLHSQVTDTYQDEKTAEEVEQFLQDAGIDDAYIDEKTEELLDALYAENASVDSVSDTVVSIIEESMTKLNDADPDKNFTLSEENKQEVKDAVSETLSQIAADDGSINVEELIAQLFLQALQGESGETGTEEGKTSTKTLAVSSDKEKTEQDVFEELKETLRAELLGTIDESTAEGIAQGLKIVSYLILFTFFTWAYLILKIVMKLGAKNNAIKLKLPILLGSIPFWILYLIPTAILTLLKAPPLFLVSMLGGETAAAELTEVLSMFTLKFSTCAWVSFAIGVFFIVFVLFFYGGLRRKLKRMKNDEPDEAPKQSAYESEYDDVDP